MILLVFIAVMTNPASGQSNRPPQPQTDAKVNRRDGLQYLPIQPGRFQMGCSIDDHDCTSGEGPGHMVTITRPFWMGQTEVTVKAYKQFVVERNLQMPPEPTYSSRSSVTLYTNPGWAEDQQPMVNVSWNDAAAYCTWAGGRLPTEAEWEYAARAGETKAHYGTVDEISWYAENSGREALHTLAIRASGGNLREITPLLGPNGNRTHPVAMKAPNRWGLYDMLGNAWEWVQDWWGAYQDFSVTDPQGPPTGDGRVIRGNAFGSPAWVLRLSIRASDPPTHRDAAIGFRCALDNLSPFESPARTGQGKRPAKSPHQ
jgi:formylglycine-generating enzyme required for sulfatase activity